MQERSGTKPEMSRWGAVGLAVLCGAFGLAFLGWSGSQLWSIAASSTWVQTEGMITLSEFIDNPPRRDDEARIRYIYEVDGERYEGSSLLPAPLAYGDAQEEVKVREYPSGSTATIYYDPLRPEVSALERGRPTRLTYIGLALGLMFVGGAAYIVVAGLRGRPVRL